MQQVAEQHITQKSNLPISIVLLVKNEAGRVAACLTRLGFAKELIIINNGSTDATVNVIKRERPDAYIFEHNSTSFATLRNFGDSKAREPWILHIDADELVSEELVESMRRAIRTTTPTWFVHRIDVFLGKPIYWGEVLMARRKGFIRFYKKGSGTWTGKVHETFVSQGETSTLDGYLHHVSHPSIAQFIASINTYSQKRAEEQIAHGVREHVWSAVMMPIIKFLVSYVALLGFLDGPRGFIYSFLMAFHSFLYRSHILTEQYLKRT